MFNFKKNIKIKIDWIMTKGLLYIKAKGKPDIILVPPFFNNAPNKNEEIAIINVTITIYANIFHFLAKKLASDILYLEINRPIIYNPQKLKTEYPFKKLLEALRV